MKSKTIFLSILFCCFIASVVNAQTEKAWEGVSQDFSHGKVVISTNKHFLQFEDGTPFFWLGDTAWELFHRLNKEESELYLENRRAKGFTVIQAVALAELDGLNTPNRYGEKPLIENNPLTPNEKYFEHVDWVIKRAAEKGIFIGLLPTWGDKVDKQWGVGPVIFNKENAYKYGQWIANRYKNYPNIIWINGGDRSGGGANTEIWNAIGTGIKLVDKNHLMTFHPTGGQSSSEWFQNSEWLDFNMSQTGHCSRSYDPFKTLVSRVYTQTPTKPCFDGEPRYEDHPVCWNPTVLGWFDDVDVRQAAYWNLFSGGFGHTYGCNSIWQMKTANVEPQGYARHNWNEVIDLPGAWDMLNMRRLMQSRPMLDRIPFQELIANDYVPESEFIAATKGKNYAFVYVPGYRTAKINLEKLGWKKSVVWKYNPRTGEATRLKELVNKGIEEIKPEKWARDIDLIWIFDNKDSNFGIPGVIK
jgi:hypothetical protein